MFRDIKHLLLIMDHKDDILSLFAKSMNSSTIVAVVIIRPSD